MSDVQSRNLQRVRHELTFDWLSHCYCDAIDIRRVAETGEEPVSQCQASAVLTRTYRTSVEGTYVPM